MNADDYKKPYSSFDGAQNESEWMTSDLTQPNASAKSDGLTTRSAQLKDEDFSSHQGFDQKRSDSPAPSLVSLRSDRSMQMPIHLGNKNDLQNQSLKERSNSSSPSVLSLSDRSMQMPIHLKNAPVPMDKSFQQERSNSSAPNVVSVKSERSMQMPSHLHTTPPLIPRISCQGAIKTESSPGRFTHEHVSSGSSEIIQRFKSQIKKKHLYILEGFAKQGNQILLNKIYTELYITEGGNGEINNEHEFKRIEKTLLAAAGATIQIKCNDIFKTLPGQDQAIRSVLTKGVAGIGKTVSVQKFILDWAEGKENQDVQLIFPLPFREINLMKDQTLSLSGLLHVFFPETKEMDIYIDEYKIMFIFDGLDECRLPLNFHNNKTLRDTSKEASVDELLTNLIVGNLLPSALIWITSRPAAADLVPSECVHRVTEVRGFTDPQKEEYFRKRISDQSLAHTIISHLKSSRSLYIMCHIPVFCWISASVLEMLLSRAETGQIPKTLTDMYTHFLMAQINIKDTKYSEQCEKDKNMIFNLSKLAYEQLEKGNLIFYEEDLRACGIDVTEASVYSGLCTQIFREEFGLNQGKVFCFVHLSVQEHLAALYVHLCFIDTGKNILKDGDTKMKTETNVTMSALLKCAVDKSLENKNGHLDLFLRFLMGLSLESNQILLERFYKTKTVIHKDTEQTTDYLKEKIKTSCPETSIVMFHCLNELNDHSLNNEIQRYIQSGKVTEIKSYELGLALMFILMTSDEKFDEFELRQYGGSDTMLTCLNPVIKLSTKARLHHCNITESGCITVSQLLSSQSNVKELELSHNDLQDTGVEILSVGPKNSQYSPPLIRQLLGIEENESIQQNSHYVDFMSTVAGLQDTACRLVSLILMKCGITEAGCASLSSALRLNPSHLKVLDLSWNNIGDSGVKHLCAALEKQCALETLKLGKCGITEKSCPALASALSSNTSNLTDLDLSVNDLQDSGVKKLCVGLQSPRCKLQKLRLSSCNVTHDGVAALTEALKSNPSHLKEIDLLDNHLQESDLHILNMMMDKS